ncbi:MAG: DUF2878 domain-containing protein [Phycisphaerales bacterium]|nr:MAG: DUF2878 domain-containing protein [Phycisphaerales bacterium]
MKTLLYVVGQMVGWFACVIGASRSIPWLGLLVVLGLLVFHLATRGRRSVRRILALAFFSIFFGFCFDSLLIVAGVYEPVRWLISPPFTTIWLMALWINFSLIVDVPLRWLQQHLLVASVFGAVFGPAAYVGGQRFGAIRILEPANLHSVILAAAWALGLAAFMLTARLLPTFGPRRQLQERL